MRLSILKKGDFFLGSITAFIVIGLMYKGVSGIWKDYCCIEDKKELSRIES